MCNSARLQIRKLKKNKPKQTNKKKSVFIHLLGLGYILEYEMNVKIKLCVAKGKEYDEKGRERNKLR